MERVTLDSIPKVLEEGERDEGPRQEEKIQEEERPKVEVR